MQNATFCDETLHKIIKLLSEKQKEYLLKLRSPKTNLKEIVFQSQNFNYTITTSLKLLSTELSKVLLSNKIQPLFELMAVSTNLLNSNLSSLLIAKIQPIPLLTTKIIPSNSPESVSLNSSYKSAAKKPNKFQNLAHKVNGKIIEVKFDFGGKNASGNFEMQTNSNDLQKKIYKQKARDILHRIEMLEPDNEEIQDIRDPFLLLEMSDQVGQNLLDSITQTAIQVKEIEEFGQIVNLQDEQNPVELLNSIQEKMEQFQKSISDKSRVGNPDLTRMLESFIVLNKEIVSLKKRTGEFLLEEYTRIKERFYQTPSNQIRVVVTHDKCEMTEPPKFMACPSQLTRTSIQQNADYFASVLVNLELQNFEFKSQLEKNRPAQAEIYLKNKELESTIDELREKMKTLQISLQKQEVLKIRTEKTVFLSAVICEDSFSKDFILDLEILKNRFLNLIGIVSAILKKLISDKSNTNSLESGIRYYIDDLLKVVSHAKLLDVLPLKNSFAKIFKKFKSLSEIEEFEDLVNSIINDRISAGPNFTFAKNYQLDFPIENTNTNIQEAHFQFFLEKLLVRKEIMFDFQEFLKHSFQKQKPQMEKPKIKQNKFFKNLNSETKNSSNLNKLKIILNRLTDFRNFLTHSSDLSRKNSSEEKKNKREKSMEIVSPIFEKATLRLTENLKRESFLMDNSMISQMDKTHKISSIDNETDCLISAQRTKSKIVKSEFANEKPKNTEKLGIKKRKSNPQFPRVTRIVRVFCFVNHDSKIQEWETLKNKDTLQRHLNIINIQVDFSSKITKNTIIGKIRTRKSEPKNGKLIFLRNYFTQNKINFANENWIDNFLEFVTTVFANKSQSLFKTNGSGGFLELKNKIENCDFSNRPNLTGFSRKLEKFPKKQNEHNFHSAVSFKHESPKFAAELNADAAFFGKETFRTSSSSQRFPQKNTFPETRTNLVAFKISRNYYNQVFLKQSLVQGIAIKRNLFVLKNTNI